LDAERREFLLEIHELFFELWLGFGAQFMGLDFNLGNV
jgi:hypothetical protein